MPTILKFAGLIILAVFVLSPAPGAAAPQMLGLVAAAEPTVLSCENGKCSAEFSAFCLQANRMAPVPGRQYAMAEGQGVQLLVTLGDGTTRKMAAKHLVSAKSVRGFSSVRMSVPEVAVAALSRGRTVTRIALQISPLATLIPVPHAGDAEPIDQAEIDLFAGTLRSVAESAARQPSMALDIVQTTNRLLNGREGDGGAAANEPAKYWRRTMGKVAMDDARAGVRNVAKELKLCARITREFNRSSEKNYGIRSCLEVVHDDFAHDITRKVWKALNFGS